MVRHAHHERAGPDWGNDRYYYGYYGYYDAGLK
jgi:hypothetical protein